MLFGGGKLVSNTCLFVLLCDLPDGTSHGCTGCQVFRGKDWFGRAALDVLPFVLSLRCCACSSFCSPLPPLADAALALM
jgi:hypothetical protein